jgi:PAS domain S-box-containing protein
VPDFDGSVSLQYLETDENNVPTSFYRLKSIWHEGRIRQDDPRLHAPIPLEMISTSKLWIEHPGDVTYVEDVMNDPRVDDIERPILQSLEIGSVALLPLRSGGVWQGTVIFAKPDAYTFTEEQKFIFSRLLESLAAIVASLRSLEAQRAALAESEALYAASVNFNRAETIDDVLRVIATAVSDAGAFSSALWLLETDENDVPQNGTITAVWRSDGTPPSVPLGTTLNLDNLPGADYWRYSPQNIMLVSDPKTDPRTKDDEAYQAVLDMGGYVAMAALPLTIGSRWVGVCTVQWKTTFDFDDSDMRLYTTLAAQAAVTIDGLLLLQQTQARAEQLNLQATIEAQLSRAVNEIDILHALVDHLPDTPAATLSYIEVDEVGQPKLLRSLAAYVDGEVAAYDQNIPPLDLSDVPISKLWIDEPQTALIIEDIHADPRVDEESRESLDSFESFAFLPLYSGGRWQGGITYLWPEQHTFTNTERFVYQQILESVSAVVASRRSQLEQAAAEAALREVTALQQGILNSANYSIISTDPEGVIVTVNAAAERMLEYDTEELIGKSRPTILHDFHEVEERTKQLNELLDLEEPIEPGFETFVAQARAGGIDEHEWTYLRKSGSYFPVSLSVTSLRNERDDLGRFPLCWFRHYRAETVLKPPRLAAQGETEQLYQASRQINESAGDLTQLVSTLGSLNNGPYDRAILSFIDYDELGNLKAATSVATWSNGRGPAPTPVGTRYTHEQFPNLDLFFASEPVFYDDVLNDNVLDEAGKKMFTNLEIGTMAILPLWIGSRQVGVIVLEGKDATHLDEQRKRQYLSLLPQIEVAVENRLLLDQAQARARREQVLREITEKVRSSTDIDTIMRTAAAEIGRALGRKTLVSLGQTTGE